MTAVETAPALLRITDLAGRERGIAFSADDRGTLLTSHEAVDGLARLVVHPADRSSVIIPASAVTSLPHWNLALICLPQPIAAPLLISGAYATTAGTLLRAFLGDWTSVPLTSTGPATYTATDRFHSVPETLALGLPPATAIQLRLDAQVSGSPVLDSATGAVVAVLGTALHTARQAAGFAVPLRAAATRDTRGPLQALLRRNGAAIPGFGAHLNLAGVLRITTPVSAAQRRQQGREGGPADGWPTPGRAVPGRPEAAETLHAFENADACVLALAGPPGTGRRASLAAYAAHRVAGPTPAPTLRISGADLGREDAGIRDAVQRHLDETGHALSALGPEMAPPGPAPGADAVARTTRDAGSSLLILLDAPEEMPPQLAAGLDRWCTETVDWLRATGARLALACRPEFWEQAGRLFPAGTLFARSGIARPSGVPLPDCHRLGDLPTAEAEHTAEFLGVSELIAPSERRHPLSLRMLGAIRAAQPPNAGGCPDREEIFAAHLDLMALRIAKRVSGEKPSPPAAVRRLAAVAAGRLHEAARSSVGPVLLPQRAFDTLFRWRGGWAHAVLDEGVLIPAGANYRFADEEFADWLQARHLDLDATLDRLLGPAPSGGLGAAEVSAARASDDAVAGPAAVTPSPIPRHRIGTVVFALLKIGRERGPDALRRRLQRMVGTLPTAPSYDPGHSAAPSDSVDIEGGGESGDGDSSTSDSSDLADDAHWWACHLLGEVLLRLPDACHQTGIARQLAERIGSGTVPAKLFGPWFWRRLALPTIHRVELLQLLMPADPPTDAADRFLTTAAQLLAAEPQTVQPLLCHWFDDVRPLAAHGDTTVAAAAQALLYTHRQLAPDRLADTLVDDGHLRSWELLDDLAHDEPAMLCHAVLRWSGGDRQDRRAAAVGLGVRIQPHIPDRENRARLVSAAEKLLARPEDAALHGDCYRLLLRDPVARSRHLTTALHWFTGAFGRQPAPDDPGGALLQAVTDALTHCPVPVLAAFRYRLSASGSAPETATVLLEALAGVATPPALARRITHLVYEFAHRAPPAAAEPVASFVRQRLRQGTAARAVLHPLVGSLLRHGRPSQRAALGQVLVTDGGRDHRDLLDLLLDTERDPCVLVEMVDAAARSGAGEELLGRLAQLMSRTSDGQHALDRHLAGLARTLPDFHARLSAWLNRSPERWAALVGAGARQVLAAPPVGRVAAPTPGAHRAAR